MLLGLQLILSLFCQLGITNGKIIKVNGCGILTVSSNSDTWRVLSHAKFNRRTRYPKNKSCKITFKMDNSCVEQRVYCTYMMLTANRKCTRGDVLSITGDGKTSRYCRKKKPSSKNPLSFADTVSILFTSDAKKNNRGFDCRVECSRQASTTPFPATIENTKTTPTTTTTSTGPCVVESGPKEGKPCIFPFIWNYNSVNYTGCAFDRTLDLKPWCSTKVVNGIHQVGQGEWGYCSPSCPLSEGVSTLAPTTAPPTISPGLADFCECGKVKRKSRIINGETTEINEYPWMAGVGALGSISPFCGGALVSDQYILTAAHCCYGRAAGDLQVILGDHDWTNSTEADSFRRPVDQVKMNPTYGQGKKFHNDACLLRLVEPVSFKDHDHVRPICLPSESSGSFSSSYGWIAGWGKTTGTSSISSTLQEVMVVMMGQAECSTIFPNSIDSSMMCIRRKTGPNLESTCNGDSGSSLMYDNAGNMETIGVVSWGISGCPANAPTIMSRVTEQLDWITSSISDSALCPREYNARVTSTTSPPSCFTVGGAVVGEACVFPFVVGGLQQEKCTRVDGDTRPWCSTKVDAGGSHMTGHWGYCHPDCQA